MIKIKIYSNNAQKGKGYIKKKNRIMDNLLETKGLSKTYGHTYALIGVNVSVSEGSAEKDRSAYPPPPPPYTQR
ncbi:MAG: hypothetical protein LBL45_01175 [Treponema sp.]|jgi:hypothetical protein|nr:hypothetical protein [Treponema sp.]